MIILVGLLAAPTTAPISNFESPEALRRAYHDAARSLDKDGLQKLFIAESEAQQKFVDATIENDLALNRLAKVVNEVFKTSVSGGGAELPVGEQVTWQEKDGIARVEGERPHEYPPVRRTENGWRIDLWSWTPWWTKEPGSAKAKEELESMHAYTRHLEKQAERIKEGVYWHVNEFREPNHWDANPRLLRDDAVGEEKPDKRPTTRAVKVDLTSPRATFETAVKALAIGDASSFERAMLGDNKKEVRSLKLLGRWAKAETDFRLAAVSKFGTEGWEIYLNAPMPSSRRVGLSALAELDEGGLGELKVKGDEATFERPTFGSGEFVRVGGEWRMRLTPKEEMNEQEDPNQDDSEIFRRAASVYEEMAKRVGEGEFETAAEAQKMLDKLTK